MTTRHHSINARPSQTNNKTRRVTYNNQPGAAVVLNETRREKAATLTLLLMNWSGDMMGGVVVNHGVNGP
jgi:hypothetical protein